MKVFKKNVLKNHEVIRRRITIHKKKIYDAFFFVKRLMKSYLKITRNYFYSHFYYMTILLISLFLGGVENALLSEFEVDVFIGELFI